MKKIIFTIGYIIFLYSVKAQVLYGTTLGGGNNSLGAICKLVTNTNELTAAFSFNDPATGRGPQGSLIQAVDGNLYGLTTGGGSSDKGVIFSYNPVSSAYLKRIDFTGANGANPQGGLVQASDGKLYGMTITGGDKDSGVIFSYDPVSSIFLKLKDLDNASGAYPMGSLIQASDGKLYGMTSWGGSNNFGVIFSYDPSTFTFSKLKDLDEHNGSFPKGSLLQASDGKLYGMTQSGGSYSAGVIFSYDLSASVYLKLKDFSGADGFFPMGSLIQASDGKLYGMTLIGGNNYTGNIFSYDPVTTIFTNLKEFDGINGANPWGSLFEASDGKLYGVTNGGGNGGGVSFSYDPAIADFIKLADFNGSNGTTPGYLSFIEITYTTVAVSDASVIEGNNRFKIMNFIVKLTTPASNTVTVKYKTRNGTAIAGRDYLPSYGTLIFRKGEIQKTIRVLIMGDKYAESDETYKVVLSNPVNISLGDSIAVGKIINDDSIALLTVKSISENSLARNLDYSVTIWPNPANNFIKVELNASFGSNYSLQLLDMQGKVLMKKEVQAVTKNIQQQINISQFAKGTYLFVVTGDNGILHTEKIVIQ